MIGRYAVEFDAQSKIFVLDQTAQLSRATIAKA